MCYTTDHNTIQYNTIQYNTIQYNATQHYIIYYIIYILYYIYIIYILYYIPWPSLNSTQVQLLIFASFVFWLLSTKVSKQISYLNKDVESLFIWASLIVFRFSKKILNYLKNISSHNNRHRLSFTFQGSPFNLAWSIQCTQGQFVLIGKYLMNECRFIRRGLPIVKVHVHLSIKPCPICFTTFVFSQESE